MNVIERLEKWSSTGNKFKVSKAYDMLRPHEPKIRWHRVVWEGRNTPKHSFILWMATLDKLSTYDRLAFLHVDSVCRWCQTENETHHHVFFECQYPKNVGE